MVLRHSTRLLQKPIRLSCRIVPYVRALLDDPALSITQTIQVVIRKPIKFRAELRTINTF